MPIETICQGCARKLRVPDEHAGKRARCPQCGTIYIVPGAEGLETPIREERAWGGQIETEAPTSKGDDTWLVRIPDGRVYGPVPKHEVDQWVVEGRVTSDAFVQREGERQWRAATEIYPRLPRSRKVSPAVNPFSEAATPAPIRAQRPRYRTPHRGGMILCFGILGWALCPVFAPFAWAMGSADLRAMRIGRMDPQGMSITQAGMILGIIETILALIVMVFACLGSIG